MPKSRTASFRQAAFVMAILFVIALCTPGGLLTARFFALGFRHGIEDTRTGITYSDNAPGMKIFRNGPTWSPNDIDLVRHLFASSPKAINRDVSIFMTGYHLGQVSPVTWSAGVGVVVLLFVLRNRIKTLRKAAKRPAT